MAERQQNFTDFRDPFDLLTSLHNTRMRMIYQNEFARGNRTDMNMGYNPNPTSQVGKTSMAQDRLQVNAPSREMESLNAPSRGMPSPQRIGYNVDFGTADLNRRELKRLGTVIGPLAQTARKAFSNIADIRKAQREQNILGPYQKEMADIEEQIGQTKQNIEMGKGLLDLRTQSLTEQHATDTARNTLSQQRERERKRESLNTIAGNIPEATTETLSKVPGISPYGMLETPDETRTQRINQAMTTLFKDTSPLPPPSGMSGSGTFNVPWSPNIPVGASEPLSQGKRDINTATLSTATPKRPSSVRKKLPPPPPPQAPGMAPPTPSQLPPPPMGKGPKNPKGPKAPPKGTKTTKAPKPS